MIYEIDYDVPSDRVLLDGGALRYARKSRNMTAKDLADAAKISQGQLSNIEQMKSAPLKSVAQRLADVLVRQLRNVKVTMDAGGFAYGAYKATEYAQKRVAKAYKELTGEDLP